MKLSANSKQEFDADRKVVGIERIDEGASTAARITQNSRRVKSEMHQFHFWQQLFSLASSSVHQPRTKALVVGLPPAVDHIVVGHQQC